MSEEIQKGKFESSTGNVAKLLQWGTAPLEDKYDQMWLNLQPEEINTVANAGESVVAYNTLQDPFVQDVELHDSVGGGGLEAIIDVPMAQQYLGFVGGDRITLTFYGREDERGCTKMSLDGDLTATVYLPSSESDYESKALRAVERYDDDEKWITADETRLDTSWTTRVDQFEKIVEAKDEFDNLALSTYPVTIKDGEFRIDANDDNNRYSVSGSLWAEDVGGPDLQNHYTRAFAELFDNIAGEVEVMAEQDSLITVVRESNDNSVLLRYSVLPAA
jgi:hypothetical protein